MSEKGTECLVFGCSRRSRKNWLLYICGPHWKLANREDKTEARRLDRVLRDNPNMSARDYRSHVKAVSTEFDKIAKTIFERENGI